MQKSQLAKYKIGLLVLGVFTAVLLVMVLVQASATKQDAQTDEIANDDANKLNDYTNVQFTVPESLQQAGITKSSPNITYTKLSDSKYKFCVTYKAASSGFDATQVEADLATGGSSADFSTGTGTSSYLYIPVSHHKGANCQTIDTGSGFSSSPSICGDALNTCFDDSGASSSSSSSFLGSTSSAADSERETDIDAMDSHLEAYYANNGSYPTYLDMNDASWRSKNLLGMEASALCDPSAKATTNCSLSTDSKKGVYSYQATSENGVNCENDTDCTAFTLTATLSDGSRFTKQSNT